MACYFGSTNLAFASNSQAFTRAAAWAEDRLSLRTAAEFGAGDFPGRYYMAWGPDPAYIPDRPIKIGSLFWPPDARNFAVAHFLVTDNQLEEIRDETEGVNPLTLTLDDGRSDPVETSLYMLPARPLAQRADTNGLHLLTLVDQRYFWWRKSEIILVRQGVTTWGTLFGLIGSALGVGITVESISSAYMMPSAALTSRYKFIPLLLDAACRCVGMRLVRTLSGAVKVQKASTASATADSNFSEYAPSEVGKEAGGFYDFTA